MMVLYLSSCAAIVLQFELFMLRSANTTQDYIQADHMTRCLSILWRQGYADSSTWYRNSVARIRIKGMLLRVREKKKVCSSAADVKLHVVVSLSP
jgi:hypothetical protein